MYYQHSKPVILIEHFSVILLFLYIFKKGLTYDFVHKNTHKKTHNFSLASIMFHNVLLHCHHFFLLILLYSMLQHSLLILSFFCLCLYLPASLRDSPGSWFLSLVNWCLALRRRHVIGCLTRLTLAVHILPHGTIKGKTDFRLRPKFIDWNNCIPKTLRHFSP